MSFATYVKQNTLGIRLNLGGLTRSQLSAMVLAVITGGVHLYLFATQSFVPFLLAGLGFLTLAGLMATSFDHRLLYFGGVVFTLTQISAWVMLGMPDFLLGVADKTVQVALIGLLTTLYVSEHRSAVADRTRTETSDPKGVVR